MRIHFNTCCLYMLYVCKFLAFVIEILALDQVLQIKNTRLEKCPVNATSKIFQHVEDGGTTSAKRQMQI